MSLKVTWFGHATWLLEQAGLRILVDPFLDDNPQSPVKADEVVCDTILVTHGHADHIADAAVIARKNQAPVYASYEVASWLALQGVAHTVGMNLGGGCATKFGEVRMVPAWHSSSLPDGSYGGACGGLSSDLGDTATLFGWRHGPVFGYAIDSARGIGSRDIADWRLVHDGPGRQCAGDRMVAPEICLAKSLRDLAANCSRRRGVGSASPRAHIGPTGCDSSRAILGFANCLEGVQPQVF
jgi:hypothetical protein